GGGVPLAIAILLLSIGRSSCCRSRHLLLRLHSRVCCIQVQTSILDVLVDLPGCLEESVFHVFSGFGRALEEGESVLLSKCLRLLICDVPLCIQIGFVPDQEDNRVWIREISGISEPTGEMVVRRSASDIVHHESTRCSTVVRTSHRTES
ncbi:hypothetical protein PMAYCL1PPCAC_02334, partial [Pristionchus mayeri]